MKTKRVLCPERLPMRRTALVGSINGWCAMATSLGVVLKRWPFTCYWSRWPMRGLSYYSNKTAARLLSLNEAQLREARHSLLAAGLIAYESPLYVPELLEIIEHYHGER